MCFSSLNCKKICAVKSPAKGAPTYAMSLAVSAGIGPNTALIEHTSVARIRGERNRFHHPSKQRAQ